MQEPFDAHRRVAQTQVGQNLKRSLPTLAIAAALALAAAVSLGLARFSYAMLLPPMRADLGWSYLTAGGMNTLNAAGYLAGALLMPRWLRRFRVRRLLLSSSMASGLLLIAHGTVTADAALYGLRFLTGVASAATFVAGGLMAARLTVHTVAPDRTPAGLVLGVYYGGAGLGIVAAALLVPPLAALPIAHAWQWAWVGLGATALIATAVTAAATRGLGAAAAPLPPRVPFAWRCFGFGLTAYFLFGLGYIGYMTFIVTLLHEQALGARLIVMFYVLLGLAVVASSWLWAGVLQRCRGGEALRSLNALLAVATLLPVLSVQPVVVFVSGLMFGGVFLSVVASTTALVRHNLPLEAWPAGIGAFTIVFATGQIVGPTLVGLVADGDGGLRVGLACSAGVLALAALCGWGQKPLATAAPQAAIRL